MPLNAYRSVVEPCRRRLGNVLTSLLPAAQIRKSVLRSNDLALYVDTETTRPQFPVGPASPAASEARQSSPRLVSSLCRTDQLESQAFRDWAVRLRLDFAYHRKLWEYCFVCQALDERGLLASGRRGLGFAVGREPLPALFASLGCQVLATDLDVGDPRTGVWSSTRQWAGETAALDRGGLCDPELLRERVSVRPVDMNHIPNDLGGFDFTWSSCSFEHCGSITLGMEFLCRQMQCLKPGGVAVHTTEFNLTSNRRTITRGDTVIFRRRDIEKIVRRLIDAGHSVEPLDLTIGDHAYDQLVDRPPFERGPAHLRLVLGRYAVTSIGLIIRKAD